MDFQDSFRRQTKDKYINCNKCMNLIHFFCNVKKKYIYVPSFKICENFDEITSTKLKSIKILNSSKKLNSKKKIFKNAQILKYQKDAHDKRVKKGAKDVYKKRKRKMKDIWKI